MFLSGRWRWRWGQGEAFSQRKPVWLAHEEATTHPSSCLNFPVTRLPSLSILQWVMMRWQKTGTLTWQLEQGWKAGRAGQKAGRHGKSASLWEEPSLWPAHTQAEGRDGLVWCVCEEEAWEGGVIPRWWSTPTPACFAGFLAVVPHLHPFPTSLTWNTHLT